MLFQMRFSGLIKRGGMWTYRREIPPKLRSFLGKREIKVSLRTTDEAMAQRRWRIEHERTEQLFREAAKGQESPAIAAYKAVQAHTWGDPRSEEGLDMHLTTLLDERGDSLDPVQRAAILALLARSPGSDQESDNPPLSILFDRHQQEKKLPGKTAAEWQNVLAKFTAACGDLPVRSITQAHVRSFKASLLGALGSRLNAQGKPRPLSPATIRKSLGALSSVLAWAQREGYIPSNPAQGITVPSHDTTTTLHASLSPPRICG